MGEAKRRKELGISSRVIKTNSKTNDSNFINRSLNKYPYLPFIAGFIMLLVLILDLINYYSGDFYSICASDWGTQMEELADTVAVKRMFPLSEDDPIEDTIKVYVNGQEVGEDAARYDSTENLVEFASGSEPDPGDTIEIVYATWGCE